MASRLARLTLTTLTTLTTGALVTALLMAPTTIAGAAPAARAATQAAGDGTIDILVLGDSYSAGNGATDDAGAVQSYGPDGCRRSRVNWSEKYAAALRLGGQAVRVVNHACSGGVTADFTMPRVMDTASGNILAPQAGVTTTAEAEAYLVKTDPCNTRAFPDEEFWTYHATSVLTYDCTRNLRPQTDFVNADVDLVLFTMGGNDAGFSSIVQNCFVPVARMATACKGKVDAARALLPTIRERLLTGIAAIRAHGLRDDAKMVQLGYPWLQTDNNFTLTDTTGSYDAGTQVRSLVTDGDDSIAGIVPTVNVGHPGQLTFLAGVPEKFSGHEPDATTPIGNAARWINQVADGDAIEVWYHPNRLGQIAYAELLTARGTFGAPTGPPSVTTTSPVAATVKARVRAKVLSGANSTRRARPGEVRLRVKVRLTDGSRARGKLVVRSVAGHRTLSTRRLRAKDHGTVVVTLRLRPSEAARSAKLKVVYRDRVAPTKRITRRVHTGR